MDTETRDLLIRIDERTKAIDAKTDSVLGEFKAHEERDRQDFHEVFKRINSLERRQQWALGVGSTVAFFVGLIVAWFKTKHGV